MKLPGSKLSAYEVVKTLFEEFTPKEIEILDGKSCAIPHMYSFLLEASKDSELGEDFDFDTFKQRLLDLFSKKRKIRDHKFQKDLFHFFISFLSCPE